MIKCNRNYIFFRNVFLQSLYPILKLWKCLINLTIKIIILHINDRYKFSRKFIGIYQNNFMNCGMNMRIWWCSIGTRVYHLGINTNATAQFVNAKSRIITETNSERLYISSSTIIYVNKCGIKTHIYVTVVVVLVTVKMCT